MKRLLPLILFLATPLLAQMTPTRSGVDLEVTVQFASETARGGEPFSYTARIANIGDAKATEVFFVNEVDSSLEITGAVPGKGRCEIEGPSYRPTLRCSLGDLDAGEAVEISIATRLFDDFGGPNELEINERTLKDFALSGLPKTDKETLSDLPDALPTSYRNDENDEAADTRKLIGDLATGSVESDINLKNNEIDIRVNVLPNRNAAPQIKITTPQRDAVLTRPAKKSTKFTVTIQASDPDGTIERVIVDDPNHTPHPVIEDGQYKFVYEGKTYEAKELDDLLKANPVGRTAKQTGKNSFVYTVTDPPYGRNRVSVTAVDNGGRRSFANVDFTVKGDASVVIVSPKAKQIVAPGSAITVEMISRLNEGQVKEINLFSDGPPYGEIRQAVLVSKQGNVYRHRYTLKNVAEGHHVYTNLRAVLVEDSGAITESQAVGFLVRQIPTAVFTSIKNGQTFENVKKIDVLLDIQNRMSSDDLKVYIDGEYRTSVSSGYIWNDPEIGTHTIQIAIEFDGIELSRSEKVTIHVR
jgi:hypothetical protein